jgi:hypothetical protein
MLMEQKPRLRLRSRPTQRADWPERTPPPPPLRPDSSKTVSTSPSSLSHLAAPPSHTQLRRIGCTPGRGGTKKRMPSPVTKRRRQNLPLRDAQSSGPPVLFRSAVAPVVCANFPARHPIRSLPRPHRAIASGPHRTPRLVVFADRLCLSQRAPAAAGFGAAANPERVCIRGKSREPSGRDLCPQMAGAPADRITRVL